jgi:hypothetical protein
VKTTVLVILSMTMTIFCSHPIHAGIRCENDIISIGDTSSEVMIKLSRCGKVLSKEVVSKETVVDADDDKEGKKVKKETVTEIWYIRVKERGSMYCYPLSFEEGLLKNIGNWSRCD